MKKLFAILLSALLLALGAVSFAACGKDGSIAVYMPDGAPALAMAQPMSEDMQFGRSVRYNVVAANTIQTYVTGASPKADVCILPVNTAAQTLGDGSVYRMLGAVTHGNIYFLSAKHPEESLSAQNLSQLLSGKTVGCIQLSSFVGLTLKLVLRQYDIEFAVIEDVSQAQAGRVNLLNIADPATGITAAAEYDYMVAAEPVVTTKVNATAANPEGKRLVNVGDLQSLYGEGGYPQAVLVAKTSLIEQDPELISALTQAVAANAAWIAADSTAADTVASAVQAHMTKGAASSLTPANLSKEVIARCAVRYESAADCKERVVSFLQALGEVSDNTFDVADSFFFA